MRILLTTATSGQMLGFAKKKFFELERLRKHMGVAILTKSLMVAEYSIHIKTSDWDNYIRIGGAFMVPTMVLSGADGTSLYNYLDNILTKGSSTINGQLFQGQYDRLFQLQADSFFRVKNEKIINERMLPDFFVAAGLFPEDNLSVLLVNNILSAYQTTEKRFLDKVLMPVRPGWKVQKAGHTNITKRLTSHILYIGVLSFSPGIGGSQWNKLSSPELDFAAPDVATYQSFGTAWRWYPRIWNPSIGNYLFLYQGMYYGSILGGGFWGPCSEVEARFGCILDCRGGGNPFGYAEFLSSTTYEGHEYEPDGEQKHIRAFFFREFWEPSRGVFYNESRGKIWFQNDYWESCPKQEFSIDFSSHFDIETEHNDVYLDWWSSPDIISDGTSADPIPVEGVMAISSTSGKWALYRRTGCNLLIKEGTGYKDHSMSTEGTVVSVLYQDEEALTHVFVFNLAGKENEEDPGFGNGKVLADNIIPETNGGHFHFGQLIPIDISKPPSQATVIDGCMTTAEVPAYRDKGFDISMFGMSHPWPPGNGYRASGWKVTLLDGLIARGFRWIDECWEYSTYTMYHDEDVDQFASSNLIMAGGPEGRHGTVGDISNDGFPSYGGSSPAGEGLVVQRAGIWFGQDIYSCLRTTENAKPPFIWSGDVEESGIFGADGGCWKLVKTCSEISTVKLIDDCGQEVTINFKNPLNPLILTGEDAPTVGDAYAISGGKAPYSWSFVGGSISDTGVITDITACNDPGSGEAAIGYVKVTDDCGGLASIEVRLPGGHWGNATHDYADGFRVCPNCGLSAHCTTIAGGTKTEQIWKSCHADCLKDWCLLMDADYLHGKIIGHTHPCTGKYDHAPAWCWHDTTTCYWIC